LQRALKNFVETFPLFAAAVLTAHVAATHSWMTEWGVQLYFWARIVYLALYAAGLFCCGPLYGTWRRSDRLDPPVSRKAMSRPSELRFAQVSIGVLLLVIIRSLGEYFRLQYLHGDASSSARSLHMSLVRCSLRLRLR